MIYVLLSYLLLPILYFLILIRKKRDIKKILVIQTAKIGDFICSTHLFREIKKMYPHSRLSVMVNYFVRELAELNPYIDEVIPITPKEYKGFRGKLRLVKIIRKGSYDVGITLNPNVPFAVALFWGLVPIRLSVMPNFSGFTFRLASKLFTYLEPHKNTQLIVETYLKMLKAIGIESKNLTKEVYKIKNANIKVEKILSELNKPLVGIAIGSGNKLKELETKTLIKLINKILEESNYYVVLIGAYQDQSKSEEILRAIYTKDRVINAVGKFSLGELPALLEKLDLFIGVDTGITYMADALNIPIIHLAGPVDISEQRPIGKNVISIQYKLSCVPCSFVFKTANTCKIGTRECIKNIKIEDIWYAVQKLIKFN